MNSKVTSQCQKCVLVVGVLDYLSDYCMERLKLMEANFKDRVTDKNGGLFTFGSKTIVDTCSTHFKKYTSMVEKKIIYNGVHQSFSLCWP